MDTGLNVGPTYITERGIEMNMISMNSMFNQP